MPAKQYLFVCIIGEMLHPDYVGHTWFLSEDACPTEARRLREVFKLSNVDGTLVCRSELFAYASNHARRSFMNCMQQLMYGVHTARQTCSSPCNLFFAMLQGMWSLSSGLSRVSCLDLRRQGRADYWQICRSLGDSLYQLDPLQPIGVLDGLKVGSNLRGFFTALTLPFPSKAWYQRQAPLPNQAPPMVGCHITVQGDGVQWLHAEVAACTVQCSAKCSSMHPHAMC